MPASAGAGGSARLTGVGVNCGRAITGGVALALPSLSGMAASGSSGGGTFRRLEDILRQHVVRPSQCNIGVLAASYLMKFGVFHLLLQPFCMM